MLDDESLELDDESVLAVLVVALVDVLSVVMPSDESAEAIAAASGLTLSVPDEASEAIGADIWLPPEFCAFAW